MEPAHQQNGQWTEGQASEVHRLASDCGEVPAYWATSYRGIARGSTRATGIIASAPSVKFQSPHADRNRMMGLSAPAVVLFAGVLLVGGVALVLDATRRFWKR